ncbi:MAG: hypothetical protein V3W34_08760 [Phycisphaerae bacterium]
MRDLLESYKPGASARLHLLLAAGMWTMVGAMLLLFGARWTFAGRMPRVWLLVLAAVAVGLIKGRFVLDRTAVRVRSVRFRRGRRC